jgi:hypothetical protein
MPRGYECGYKKPPSHARLRIGARLLPTTNAVLAASFILPSAVTVVVDPAANAGLVAKGASTYCAVAVYLAAINVGTIVIVPARPYLDVT